jgi:hypothetical protein
MLIDIKIIALPAWLYALPVMLFFFIGIFKLIKRKKIPDAYNIDGINSINWLFPFLITIIFLIILFVCDFLLALHEYTVNIQT